MADMKQKLELEHKTQLANEKAAAIKEALDKQKLLFEKDLASKSKEFTGDADKVANAQK